jgi:hypothetical protein
MVEQGGEMSRAIAAVAIVLGFTFTNAAIGQDSSIKTKTRIKGDDAQTVTYTGCVQTGAQTRSFVLDKVVPVGQSTSTATDAAITLSQSAISGLPAAP